nr:unnamed protein product [Callosobruchus chinensis]
MSLPLFKQYNGIRNNDDRILDLVVSNIECVVDRDYSPLVNEDNYHPSLLISLKINYTGKGNFEVNNQQVRYNFRRADFHSLYNDFLNINWDFLKNEVNSNDAIEYLYEKIYETLDKHVPRYKNFKHKYPSWYTSEVINIVKQKAKVHKKFKKSGDAIHYLEFTRLRRKFKQKPAKAYKKYLETVQDLIKEDPTAFWSFIHNKNNTSSIPRNMMYNGETVNDPQSIVNTFADFFSSVYSVPDHTNVSCDYVFDHNVFIDISCEPISESEILLASRKLKNKMTSGPDQIPSFLVKDCIKIFVTPLKYLFNLILNTTVFPDKWKAAKVCPIPKTNNYNLIGEYRAIAILNNFAKVLEVILYNRIYLSTSKHLSIHQHGFMRQRSTLTNLMVFSQNLCDNLDNRGQVDVVYTDFSKAFDKVSHQILLQKLHYLGFNDTYISLLRSYLSERKQYVFYNGYRSHIYTSTSGVPQGSNLGPLLFIIFVNDLCDSLKCSRLMFADDLKLYTCIYSVADCDLLQEQIKSLQGWCSINQLQLNVSKCKVVTFTRKKVS